MPQHGHHHRVDLLLQCGQRHLRLHLWTSTCFPSMETANGQKSEDYSHSDPGNGLCVSFISPILFTVHSRSRSAAIAVLVRMAYVRDFADPDFLCKSKMTAATSTRLTDELQGPL